MKSRLPILLLTFTSVTSWGNAEAAEADQRGKRLVKAAAEQLANGPPLTAKISQDIRMFGQELTGTGHYEQYGNGSGKTKLSLSLAAQGEVFSRVLQISDGERFLFLRREKGKTQRSLSVIDLSVVQQALQKSSADGGDPPQQFSLSAWGGISRMLEQLAKSFDYGKPTATKLGSREIPALTVRGTWNREVLERLLPNHKQAIAEGRGAPLDELASHLPHAVEITLGNDEHLPLFPYRIVFLRQDDNGALPNAWNGFEPMVELRLFEVQLRPDLKPEEFDYNPKRHEDDDIELVDRTEAFLSRLNLSSPSKD